MRQNRKTKGKIDIYYYEHGKKQRIRSPAEAKEYCTKNDTEFESDIFYFKATSEELNPILEEPKTLPTENTEDEVMPETSQI